MDDKKIDDLKGRAKEAAGDLTDDPDLKREGQTDRAAAGVKAKVDTVTKKAHDRLDEAKDKVEGAVDRARQER
jgi:uncharacterized protein YjbJ (UPF0337 family)